MYTIVFIPNGRYEYKIMKNNVVISEHSTFEFAARELYVLTNKPVTMAQAQVEE